MAESLQELLKELDAAIAKSPNFVQPVYIGEASIIVKDKNADCKG